MLIFLNKLMKKAVNKPIVDPKLKMRISLGSIGLLLMLKKTTRYNIPTMINGPIRSDFSCK